MIFSRTRFIIALSVSLLVLSVTSAHAHRVNIFAYAEGNTVMTESFFSGGKPAMNSKVEVFDSSGKKLLEGKTDNEGIFSFAIPARDDLKIVVYAGEGHRSEYIVKKSELPASEGEPVADSAEPDSAASGTQGINNRSTQPVSAGEPVAISNDCITEEIMNKTIKDRIEKEKIKIKKDMLLEQRRNAGPSIVKLIGGLGYIFGIMGLWLFFIGRKKSSE